MTTEAILKMRLGQQAEDLLDAVLTKDRQQAAELIEQTIGTLREWRDIIADREEDG